jgi:hypothetical protein
MVNLPFVSMASKGQAETGVAPAFEHLVRSSCPKEKEKQLMSRRNQGWSGSWRDRDMVARQECLYLDLYIQYSTHAVVGCSVGV